MRTLSKFSYSATLVLALVLFLALWELCTRLDMVDDFIFSSPSRVFFCFRKMVMDGSMVPPKTYAAAKRLRRCGKEKVLDQWIC